MSEEEAIDRCSQLEDGRFCAFGTRVDINGREMPIAAIAKSEQGARYRLSVIIDFMNRADAYSLKQKAS